MLRSTARPLAMTYDLAMLDLDGVVYVGEAPVRHAAASIAAARSGGMTVAFITNNAARTPQVVAEHLTALGAPASEADVVTSAQAAAHLLRTRFGPAAPVLFAGGPGVEAALVAEGLTPTIDPTAAVAVVTGYGPDLPWRRIMQAAIAVRSGLPWVATNADLTIPTVDGVGPGHGALVRLIEEFSGVTPTVAGKPERPLLDETVRRVGGEVPLMVGDRLDTDIEGAHNAGVDSLLVLTGVSGLADLVVAPPRRRPTYISPDLGGLLAVHPAPQVEGDGVRLGGWTAAVDRGALVVSGAGGTEDDWWRVAAVAAWRHLDATGRPVSLSVVSGSVAWSP